MLSIQSAIFAYSVFFSLLVENLMGILWPIFYSIYRIPAAWWVKIRQNRRLWCACVREKHSYRTQRLIKYATRYLIRDFVRYGARSMYKMSKSTSSNCCMMLCSWILYIYMIDMVRSVHVISNVWNASVAMPIFINKLQKSPSCNFHRIKYVEWFWLKLGRKQNWKGKKENNSKKETSTSTAK